MKTRIIIFLLLVNILSCDKSETPKNIQTDSPPILEISQDAQGAWDVTGKTLFFRLSNNGIAEFEYTDNKKKIPGKAIYRAEEVDSLVQTKISDDELQKFNSLFLSENFSKFQNSYKRKCCCTDATIDFQIKIKFEDKQKEINLNNYCGVEELKSPPEQYLSDFPHEFSGLMIITDNIRRKYTPQ